MVAEAGLEPTTFGLWARRATNCSTPRHYSFHIYGAEDRNRTGTVFNHRRILSPVRLPVPPLRHILVAEIGLEPTTPRVWTECSSQLSYSAISMVAGAGLEPTTFGLWARRATNCSTPRHYSFHIYGAEDRNRTGTVFNHRRILSPVRLPVPPLRHIL